MPRSTYTLIRSGDFYAAPSGSAYCGLSSTAHRFKYQVTIHCADEHLDDPRGFLIDNNDIQAYFDAVNDNNKSCEFTAREAAHFFAAAVPKACSVEVDISAFAGGIARFRIDRPHLYAGAGADNGAMDSEALGPLVTRLQGPGLTLADV